MMELGILLAGMFLLGVALNALFAGYETGFVMANPIRVRHRAESEGDPAAKRLLIYMEHPDRMITVVLLGTNIALVMGSLALARLLVNQPILAAVIATPMFLFFGEVLPKSMFRVHPTRLSLKLLPVIRFFEALMFPLVLPVLWMSRSFLRLVEAEQRDIRSMVASQDDMRVLVDESADHGHLEEEEKEMIHRVMDLQTRLAKEIMVPRIDMLAISESATRAELAEMLTKSGFTRIPVYRGNHDEIVGIVSAFSLLNDPSEDGEHSITPFIKDVLHVPDTMKLDDVLRRMREQKQRLAIVTDEYGGTDGLITIEDIIEEIFGEIHDEHDKAERSIRKVGPSAYVIDARTSLSDVASELAVPIEDDEVETIGGWIMHQAGRIPQRGEELAIGPFQVTVLNGGPNYLSSLRIELQPEAFTGDEREQPKT